MQKMILLPNSTRPTFIEKIFTFTITYHYENLFEILYSSPNYHAESSKNKKYGWGIQNVTEFVSIALFYKWQLTRMMTS